MSAGHNGQIRSIVERIERLEEDQKGLAEDKREIYAEAKSNGFDTKALREIIRRRRQDPAKLDLHNHFVDAYENALAGLSGTVFEDAARQNAEAAA